MMDELAVPMKVRQQRLGHSAYVRAAVSGFLANLSNEIEEYLAEKAAEYLRERFDAEVASVEWKEIIAALTADAKNHGLPVDREPVIRAINEGYERVASD